MRRISRLLAVTLVASLAVNNAFAWGPEGHRIVAIIAYRQLTKSLKNKIDLFINSCVCRSAQLLLLLIGLYVLKTSTSMVKWVSGGPIFARK